MVIFTPQKREFYTSHGMGPGNEEMDDETWNLVALTIRSLYAYEKGRGISKLPCRIDPKWLEAVKDSIKHEVGGVPISSFMRLDSPFLFLEELQIYKPDHLPIAKILGGVDNLILVVKARSLTWKKQWQELSQQQSEFVRMISIDY